jgi:tetratricopeptide (TPR) repeat protein
VIDEGEDALRRGLAHLQAAEFLYETRLFPELEYTFKHALTHEVAYGTLLHDRRRDLHARIADAIETAYAGRIVEQVERLAHHAVRGEAWVKAVQYLDQAAAKARSRSAHREAVALLEDARSALRRLQEDRRTIERAIDLRLDLRASLVMLDELDRVREVLDEAEALARSVGDEHRLGYVLACQGHYHYLVGDHDRAIEACSSAQTLARVLGDVALEVAARTRLGGTLTARGYLREARAILTETVAHLGSEDPSPGHSILMPTLARVHLVQCLADLGEFPDAIAVGEEAMRRAEAAHHPDSVVHAGLNLGEAHLRKGNVPQATRALERAFSLCKDESHRLLHPRVASALACAYALAGHSREALDLCAEASARNIRRSAPRVMIWVGEAHLLAGRADDAITDGRRGLDVARQQNARGSEALALGLLGDACARRGQPDAEQVEGCYREAITLGTEVGMRPLVAHCHAGLAKLYRRTGKPIESDEHFATAASMYREMDMRFWLAKNEAEVKGLS